MKQRYSTVAFLYAAFLISLYATINPAGDLTFFFETGAYLTYFRAAIAGLLLLYVFIPFIRLPLIKNFVIASGMVLAIGSVATIYSPMLFGLRDSFLLVGDMLFAMEGGVLLMLAGMQLETRKVIDTKARIPVRPPLQTALFNTGHIIPQRRGKWAGDAT